MKGQQTHRHSNVVAIVFSVVLLPRQLTCSLAFNMSQIPTKDLHNVHRQLVARAASASSA